MISEGLQWISEYAGVVLLYTFLVLLIVVVALVYLSDFLDLLVGPHADNESDDADSLSPAERVLRSQKKSTEQSTEEPD